jgi:hypothetical protein
MNQNGGLTSRARQFSRRLSYGITKALRDWQIGKNLNFLKLYNFQDSGFIHKLIS